MSKKLSVPVTALVCAVALLAGACSKSTEATKDKNAESSTTTTSQKATTTTTAAPTDTLMALLTADNQLSEFAGLAVTSGLDATLGAGGPYTVLAPTNAAIDKVPAATMAQLQQDPAGALGNLVRLHVVPGTLTVDDLAKKDGQCIDTLGGKVKITAKGDGATVQFGGANVSDAQPQKASNGQILTVDSVVTAPATSC
ncbi:MAG: fasciclin domain-containing protein [Actinobacteria bacterium]|nr:fasciclin domain-containing protein [Actinomycetota bacterium]